MQNVAQSRYKLPAVANLNLSQVCRPNNREKKEAVTCWADTQLLTIGSILVRLRPRTTHSQRGSLMTITLYAASVPVFKQMLNSLSAILAKAEAHTAAKNIDPNVLLQARLYPDMFPLMRQVQIAAEFARGVTARLAGQEVPKYDESESTFSALRAMLDTSIGFLEGISAGQIDGQEGREIVLRAGTPKERKFNGQSYLLSYALPQFFFHVTTTYAILRHNGLDIGKRDFMGAY